MRTLRFYFFIIFFSILILNNFTNASQGDTGRVSFEKLNYKFKYTSFSFGMGLNYCNNPSLKNFIEYEIDNYAYLSQQQKLSEFYTGVEFFCGIEHQFGKEFSAKLDYSYFLKSYNVSAYPLYDFSYFNHQIYAMGYYIIPQEYSFIKLGAGAGYIYNNFTLKEPISIASREFTSYGFGIKGEAIINFQISKSFAVHLSANITQTILQDLKDNSGNFLYKRNGNNEKVNLNSLGVGLRLGLEYFIF